MKSADLLILACLAPLLLLYVWDLHKLRHTVWGEEKTASSVLWGIDAAAVILPVLAMAAMGMPLPLFYILLYGAGCLSEFAVQSKGPQKWLFINARFLIFASPHLIVIGLLALWAQMDVAGVMGNFTLRALSLVLAVSLNVAALSIAPRHWGYGRLRGIRWEAEELQLFSRFVWLWAAAVVLDSVPCLFPLPTIFPLLFLVGSNALLFLMAFLFARHVYTIMRDSDLREESLRLQAEAMEQHSRTALLEQEAYLDALTKLYTRQYALLNMASMLKSGEAFALAFLDLDRLKQINDQQGHLAGDQYLQMFSQRVKGCLRPNDIFVRYGGDEFLILMPDLSMTAAEVLLRNVQSEASADPPEGWGAPFSFGVAAALPDEGTGAEEWIAMADRVMYEDKKRRRVSREGGQ